ncbi:MAG: hypothetical protein JSR77_11855 [Planctomycetes bacterium]|nr:hypothetical protein [Planctomycetota bacterium]
MNVPLSLSLAGLPARVDAPWGQGPREAIGWVARLGYRAVQLDAAAPGVRPRELDRSARRDLASLLRRLELQLSGVDLWIPAAHFADAAHVDRAVQAVAAACDLAAELVRLNSAGRAVVSLTLSETPAPGVIAGINEACSNTGAEIADHRWPLREPATHVGIGIDPAAILMAGADPASATSKAAATPASARLSDVNAAGRVPVGQGRLDGLAYEVALVTRAYAGHLVVDLRGVRDIEAAANAPIA